MSQPTAPSIRNIPPRTCFTIAPRIGVALLATSTLLLVACTTIPRSKLATTEYAQLPCEGLAEELELTTRSATVADKARKDAWKVVLPIAAAGRYAYAANAARDARARITQLQSQQQARGCQTLATGSQPEPAKVAEGSGP